MQAEEALEGCLKNSLINKLVESPIPRSCRSGKCILGIDEAGRGPVLGPMSYGLAYFPVDKESLLARLKFADSKALTESTRESLFEAIQSKSEGFEDLGYIIKIISPNMISNSMLRRLVRTDSTYSEPFASTNHLIMSRNKYNLNALSHDTAIDMIKRLLDLGLKASHVYIDTVGPPIKYKEKLQRFFPGINFTVTEKADSKYPIVSAASVCAKVMRDRIVNKWRYVECSSLNLNAYQLGSGYPADPETKNFLERSVDPVFGFPTLARFSWSTITKALEKNA